MQLLHDLRHAYEADVLVAERVPISLGREGPARGGALRGKLPAAAGVTLAIAVLFLAISSMISLRTGDTGAGSVDRTGQPSSVATGRSMTFVDGSPTKIDGVAVLVGHDALEALRSSRPGQPILIGGW